jgi:hypothetical protein
MARLVDLIRDGAAPASMMRRAAQGGLSLPASEAIEILVALAGHRELGPEAEQTLVSWNEQSLIEVASNSETPAEVLVHLLMLHAERPTVVAALCDNSALPLAELEVAASRAERELLRTMMQSARVCSSSRLLEIMAVNPTAAQSELQQRHTGSQTNEAVDIASDFMEQHAKEVACDDAQPFELVAGTVGEDDQLDKLMARVKKGELEAAPEEVEQLSMLQRIGRMRVGERIKLAVRGNREERMVLIRDRSKLVSLAVLESPKVNDSEMESFAAMKNIQEAVLRAISIKRNYMKNYGVLRTLVNNPKTPLDVALPLLAHLLIKDLRALAINKNVNETIRKMAMKRFRLKTQKKNG